MNPTPFLRPLNQAFFERKLTTEDSILRHLEFAFQTEKGSFLANPTYGCDPDLFQQTMSSVGESRFFDFLRESIISSDPRVTKVEPRVQGRTEDSLVVDLEVHFREIIGDRVARRKIGLKAVVDLHDWNVEMERAR